MGSIPTEGATLAEDCWQSREPLKLPVVGSIPTASPQPKALLTPRFSHILLAMPKVQIMTVTPRKAAELLAKNGHNRSIRKHNVERFVRIIERDEWELSDSCLVLDMDGNILNGQHRLLSIVKAGEMFDWFKSVEMVVLFGAEPKSQDIMDTGLARRTADALQLRGEHQASKLAAALAWMTRMDLVRQTGSPFYSGGLNGALKPSTPQLLRLLDDNPDIRTSIKKAAPTSTALKLRFGLTATLHYEFSRLDDAETEVFFEKMGTGVDLKANDPIFLLRRMLLTDARATARMPDYRVAALTIKAWNYWRDGMQIRSLIWRFGGTGQEAFPLPR